MKILSYVLVFWRVFYPLEVYGASSANQWETVEIEDESLARFAKAGFVMTVLERLGALMAFQVTDEKGHCN
ncbi:hypothetical protein Hdeb2414_s0007g00226431 [Helianthus debilis subsp. tardiflorus]